MEKNNQIISNQEMLIAIKKQISVQDYLTQEKNLERANLAVMTLNKSDICKSEEGKNQFNSINRHINNYFKNMSDEEKKIRILLIGLNETTDKFREYINGKNHSIDFEKDGVLIDIKNLIKYKIYELKYQQSEKGEIGFVSPIAQQQISILMLKKYNKACLYEALGHFLKSNEDNKDIEELRKIILDIYEQPLTLDISQMIEE